MTGSHGVGGYDAGVSNDRVIPPTILSHLSKHQYPYPQDYELPLNESRSLLFSSFNGTPYVLVISREPQPNNPRTLEPLGRALFAWLKQISPSSSYHRSLAALGLPERTTRVFERLLYRLTPVRRVGYGLIKGELLPFGGRCLYPARLLFGLVKSLLVAARDALSLGKRIG